MIRVELEIGNDGVRAARREIRKFLEFETAGMAGERSDRRDEAALGYVVLRRLLKKIDAEVRRQDEAAAVGLEPRRRTVREERGR